MAIIPMLFAFIPPPLITAGLFVAVVFTVTMVVIAVVGVALLFTGKRRN